MSGIFLIIILGIWALNVILIVMGLILALRARKKEKEINELKDAEQY